MVTLEHIKTFPSKSGIYLFKDAYNNVIYIGKATNLKSRVRSYFRAALTDWKVKGLLDDAATIAFIQTKNEIEASLLEAQLIQEHKPRFNVLLKTGQPFVYLMVTKDPIPVLKIVRNKKLPGTYFGPFIKKQHARGAYTYLINTFRLFRCNKKLEHGCLDYHLGRCAGTCTKDFNPHDYTVRLELAVQALKGNHTKFMDTIKENIAEYNKTFDFEKAQALHNYAQNLETIFQTLKTHFNPASYHAQLVHALTPQLGQNNMQALHDLQSLLQLPVLPVSIDCFDISHFQSNEIVGSCVRFTNGLPEKDKFRRFKIKTLIQQHDYAALQEIVTRRYRHGDKPDVILIDGGKGQRNAIKDMVAPTPCISLAKREERLFSDLHPEGVQLDIASPVGQLLIALRDYTHHFAISYHRLRRSKQIV